MPSMIPLLNLNASGSGGLASEWLPLFLFSSLPVNTRAREGGTGHALDTSASRMSFLVSFAMEEDRLATVEASQKTPKPDRLLRSVRSEDEKNMSSCPLGRGEGGRKGRG